MSEPSADDSSTRAQAAEVVAGIQRSRPVRVYRRYGAARANVLAGGIAYFAFFSIFPCLAVGFTVLGLVLRGEPQLVERVVAHLAELLPGGVRTAANPSGIIDPQSFLSTRVIGAAGIVGLGSLVFTGLGWIDGMRQGIAAVFGETAADEGNIITTKLRDLGALLVLGLGVLVSVLTSLAATAAGGILLRLVGLGDAGTGRAALAALSFVIVLLVDTVTFVALFRLLPAVDVPWRDLVPGAVLGALGLGVLKLAGGLLLARSAGNQFLKAFGVVVGLLVWMNLIARLALLAAAFAATTAEDHGSLTITPVGAVGTATSPEGDKALQAAVPGHPPVPGPHPPLAAGPRDVLLPSFGQRSADRTSVAAGVVLGAVGAMTVGSVRSALGSVLDGITGRRG